MHGIFVLDMHGHEKSLVCTRQIPALGQADDSNLERSLSQEYAPNGELFDYIVSKGRPTIEEAQRLFQQIVTAVEYCHYHHIVHRWV